MKDLVFINKSGNPMSLQMFLHNENNVSHKLITRLKRQHMGITRNGELIRTIDTVNPDDKIVLHIDDKQTLEPNSLVYAEIVYEDDFMVIFNKPQGMPVHPSINHYTDTLGNYFAFLYPDIAFRPINRLDRNTSGLCVIAKNQYSAFSLQHSISKTYYAVVCGKISEDGVIDAPIARQTESMIKRHVDPEGQRAVTNYKVISSCEKYTYVQISLQTGRTHQIRVHFSYIGYPLAGDDLYGGNCEDIRQQALHCGNLLCENENISVSVPVNKNMKDLIERYFPY